MEPQIIEFFFRELKTKIFRKTLYITSNCFVEIFCLYLIQCCQITVQNDLLPANYINETSYIGINDCSRIQCI